MFRAMRKVFTLLFLILLAAELRGALPLSTTFRGKDKFDRLVNEARASNWSASRQFATCMISWDPASICNSLAMCRYRLRRTRNSVGLGFFSSAPR